MLVLSLVCSGSPDGPHPLQPALGGLVGDREGQDFEGDAAVVTDLAEHPGKLVEVDIACAGAS